jgi:hypothetical protein
MGGFFDELGLDDGEDGLYTSRRRAKWPTLLPLQLSFLNFLSPFPLSTGDQGADGLFGKEAKDPPSKAGKADAPGPSKR